MLNHNVAFTGGATFYRALHLGKNLARRGHRITLIASSADSFRRFRCKNVDGVDLIESPRLGFLPPLNGYDFYEVWRRLLWVSQKAYDIVHAFDSRPSVIYPALRAQRRGARLVIDWCDWFGRGGAVEQRRNPFLRIFLRPIESFFEQAFRTKASATTVINSTLENRAQALGVRPESILRFENGADLYNILPMEQNQARMSLGLRADTPILGYEGAIFQQDAALLFHAFALIRAVQPDALLLIIGNPNANVPMASGVVRTGFVSYEKLGQYLAACDVLCLPLADSLANQGRFPSKIADYFAAGRATVVCDVGDVANIVRSAQAGLVSQPTAKDFSNQILVLLTDPELRQHLGANARRAAERDFNWNTIASRVEELYLNLYTNAMNPLRS